MQIENIILDTDMDTDCDDAGALAILHNFAKHGKVSIRGIICSSPTLWSCSFVQAVNQSANPFKPIPVGGNYAQEFGLDYFHSRQKCIEQALLYCETVSRQLNIIPNKNFFPEDSLILYRKLLANAEDKSITICAVGLLSALASLLNSGPCNYSKLPGKELISKKVKKLVTMGNGIFPTGKDLFNWAMDRQSAALVFSHWPTHLTISALGNSVFSGNRLLNKLPNSNPVKQAFQIFGKYKTGFKRPSWDQIAVMSASGLYGDLFEEIPGGTIKYDAASGIHNWENNFSLCKHFYLRQLKTDKEIEEIIEYNMQEAFVENASLLQR